MPRCENLFIHGAASDMQHFGQQDGDDGLKTIWQNHTYASNLCKVEIFEAERIMKFQLIDASL